MVSPRQEKDIIIQIIKNFKGIETSEHKIKQLAKAVCNRFGKHEIKDTKYEISIAVVDDNEIRELNRKFLNSGTNTDCISFDLSDDEDGLKVFDLIVNGEMAIRQANLRGHSSQAELMLYITHGLLHNLGFDDSTKSRALEMHKTEDKILREFGYGLVYNKDTRTQEH